MKKKMSVRKILLLELLVLLLVTFWDLISSDGVTGATIMMNNMIDIPTIMSFIILIFPALAISGMWKDFFHSFTVGKHSYSLYELKRILESVCLVQRLVAYSGGISSITGIITVLTVVDDPTVLGPNLAVASIAIFYALVLELLLAFSKAGVQNEITEIMAVEDENL